MLWKIEKAIAAPFHIALTLVLAPFKVAVYHLGTFVGVFVAGVKREAVGAEAEAKKIEAKL